jgi:hypothetical protein
MHDGQRKKDKATISHKKIWMSQTIVGKQRWYEQKMPCTPFPHHSHIPLWWYANLSAKASR